MDVHRYLPHMAWKDVLHSINSKYPRNYREGNPCLFSLLLQWFWGTSIVPPPTFSKFIIMDRHYICDQANNYKTISTQLDSQITHYKGVVPRYRSLKRTIYPSSQLRYNLSWSWVITFTSILFMNSFMNSYKSNMSVVDKFEHIHPVSYTHLTLPTILRV